ncbi:MAG: 30S ribosomal protein S3 [Desulfurococcales archaeon ex4484_217_2]|nr:MAG: 30S ribosomal protein S3 [Desulfurococcales archaeon ex4484_217_2]
MVNIKKFFVQKGIIKTKVDEYLAREFYRAGYAGVDILKTPLGTRIVIYAERPAVIIGRRGSMIKQLAQIFEKRFGLENPQITVTSVENPYLSARIVAFRLAVALERGYHFRRAAFIALRRIMEAGALGAEIIISGKLTSERARYEKYRAGKIYRTGEQASIMVERAVAHALLKPGVYGIQVRIVKPMRPLDHIEIKTPETLQQTQQVESKGA